MKARGLGWLVKLESDPRPLIPHMRLRSTSRPRGKEAGKAGEGGGEKTTDVSPPARSLGQQGAPLILLILIRGRGGGAEGKFLRAVASGGKRGIRRHSLEN